MNLVFQINIGEFTPSKEATTCVFIMKNDDNPNNREVLSALIRACQLSENQVDIFTVNRNSDIYLHHAYSSFIIFTDRVEELLPHMELTHYAVIQLDKSKMVVSQSISQLNLDKSAKATLWKCLQTIFLNK